MAAPIPLVFSHPLSFFVDLGEAVEQPYAPAVEEPVGLQDEMAVALAGSAAGAVGEPDAAPSAAARYGYAPALAIVVESAAVAAEQPTGFWAVPLEPDAPERPEAHMTGLPAAPVWSAV